ncbi:MAG: hypothetical protein DRJ40_09150 [Thermoprotei archaeon]|nr:MAG: hypothetical protein DRJ40_09150 [Thermoprotei archaeon]
MRIIVEIPNVTKSQIKVNPGIKIKTLKKRICRDLGIEPELTKLLLEGELLPEDKTLREVLEQKNIRDSVRIVVDYLWARQLILWGTENQKKLRRAKVLIVGAGALGNELVKNLAQLGIGSITIVDFDTVEYSNLNRMIFFKKTDLGALKAKALAERAKKLFPWTNFNYICDFVEKIPLRKLLEHDVVVSGLDNVAARVYLSTISLKYDIPLVDGGMYGPQGRVQVVLPFETPCLACTIAPEKYSEAIQLSNPCAPPIEEVKMPSLPTTTSVVAAIEAQEVIKLVLGYREYREKGTWPKDAGKPLRGVLLIDLDNNRYTVLNIARNTRCVVCGYEGIVKEKVPVIDIEPNKVTDIDTLVRMIEDRLSTKIDRERLYIHELTSEGVVPIDLGKEIPNTQGTILQVLFRDEVRDNIREVLIRIK